jgi:hypothetical protein
VALRHNGRTVWRQEIEAIDGQGLAHDVALEPAAGDRLQFVLHRRGEITCDTTYWDPTIAYEAGPAFRASEGFSDQPGLWTYEMETDAGAVNALAPGWQAQQWGSPDGRRGLLFAARGESAVAVQMVRFVGLTPGATYRVRTDTDDTRRLGEDLARPGLPLALPAGDQVALQYELSTGATTTAVPDPPSAVSAEAGEGGVRLAWEAAPGAGVHVVWRDGDVIALVDGQSELLDGAVDAEQPHRYAVETQRGFLRSRPAQAAVHPEQRPELDLWAMVEEDWRRSGGGDPQVLWEERQALLDGALPKDTPLLFVKRVPTDYSHLVMQYFGWRARPGGGLYVLEKPGYSLHVRNLLEGQLEGGSVLDPCLSYDGKRVVFSYTHCRPDDPYFHLYEIGIDGTGLRQLTSGEYEDLMPEYLPDGGIIFCSTRRRGYARCFGAQFGDRWHVYTLHRMDADGGNLRTLSFHETNEWFPAVLNDGSVAYARWDYVDRHPVLHQNLWRTNPDGTSPVTLWGNHTESPHCCFEAQPIPGSRKIVCTASAHHSVTGGSIILVDPDVDYDGEAAIERLTPEVRFPEAEGWIDGYYATPWPLSEDHYLVSYSHEKLVPEPDPNPPNALGIYLIDRHGHRELLYRDPDIGSTSPIPLRPRPRPPVVPSALPEHATDSGEFLLLDANQGLPGDLRGQVKALRVVQVLPKATPIGDVPPVGLAGQEPARMVLGTVPVAPDGSARFVAPARKPLLFQALDERGFALQTMRSATYLQPGETASCVGCHEPRTTAPEARAPTAQRAPSAITPGPDGCAPFSYVRLVQPVLDRYCIACHGTENPAGAVDLTGTIEGTWTRSYLALTGGRTFWQGDTNAQNAGAALVPRFGGWNSVHLTPAGGAYGARGSRFLRLLQGHEGVKLDRDSLERLAIWIDSNALFYGTYDPAEQARQLRGEAIDPPELQ